MHTILPMSRVNEFGFTDEELAVQRQIEEDHELALQLQNEAGGVPQAANVPVVDNTPIPEVGGFGVPARVRETRVPRYTPAVPIEERQLEIPKPKKEKKKKSKKKTGSNKAEENDDSGWTIAFIPGSSTEFEGWGFKDVPPAEV